MCKAKDLGDGRSRLTEESNYISIIVNLSYINTNVNILFISDVFAINVLYTNNLRLVMTYYILNYMLLWKIGRCLEDILLLSTFDDFCL